VFPSLADGNGEHMCPVNTNRDPTSMEGVLAQWSKALASGASGATRAGSNPADIIIPFAVFFFFFGPKYGDLSFG
jgi:hypothetical protein